MKLFCNERTDVYFNKNSDTLKLRIASMEDDEIANSKVEQWKEYYVSKFKIDAIKLYEESIEQSISKTKVKKYNYFYGQIPWEKEYYEIDGVKITYKIPFDGDNNLLYLQPSTYMLMEFDVEKIVAPSKDLMGYIEFALEFTNKELEEKGIQMQKFVRDRYENVFKDYRDMIRYVNKDVDLYNKSLPSFIQQLLNSRQEKASSFANISKMLEIPLKPSAYAPNTVPIPLKRIAKTHVSIPEQKRSKLEYCISNKDYENINNIILTNGTAMEKTARTYYFNNEEELRDHLLATLNTHYDNVTGETFRKTGKTDIHIEFENKAAYIGECKIWHGEKMFSEAIQQVLSYSTWKDIKVSVIIFNKINRSFQNILQKIQSWVEANTKSYIKKKNNFWECVFYRSDMEVDIKLVILVFDLFVDKKQISDFGIKNKSKSF